MIKIAGIREFLTGRSLNRTPFFYRWTGNILVSKFPLD